MQNEYVLWLLVRRPTTAKKNTDEQKKNLSLNTMATYKGLIPSLLLFCGCIGNSPTNGSSRDSSNEYQSSLSEQKKLPFIGKRSFETRPGISGTGTPHRQVEIKNNGDVEFSFEQENQADKTVINGVYNAGKFKAIMRCVFKEWFNEISYYKITPDTIYEVDSNGYLLKLKECCSLLEEGDCPCESEYDSI
jgi:hypothetical protein